MRTTFLLLCVVGLTTSVPLQDDITPRKGETCGYESCTKTEKGTLNVHIVPHTHDDVGWLKTVDQYYYGSRNYIQKAGVQYILDSVIKELWEDPKRRFIYVETAFFWKWWTRQPDSIRQKVHTLVRLGRLQFVGGAWSMNDEAATHYQSTIDQFTWGLSKLNETFGYCGLPRVGWQIDPFGHAREFASLLAGMGYDGLFLGRIDYQDKQARLRGKNMEMLWRGDDDLGKQSDIFTGILYNTYSPPPGFCFDVLCDDEPIIDDPDSPMFNVDTRVNAFLDKCKNMSEAYRSTNILVTMGDDFNYQDAAMWYKNLDKLIEYANLKAAKEGLNMKLFYSTPNCYLKAVKDANPTLPTKQDDFFPYASDPHAYWTGYFTSRPTTKYFEREGNNYLQMAKQLQVLGGLEKHNEFVLNELKSAMGIMQHHDAVTGTEKQHVTHDYERLLNQAIDDSLIIPRQTFNKMMQGDALKPPIFTYDRCHFNESRCYTSEHSNTFVVTIYNPVAWAVNDSIRVPVMDGKYEVYAPNGDNIDSQLVDIPQQMQQIPTRQSKATHEIVFIAYLHPLSYKSFYIRKVMKTKREVQVIIPKYKRKLDYHANVNDYWKEIRDKTQVGIKDIDLPQAPIYKGLDANNLDSDTLKDYADALTQYSRELDKLRRDTEHQTLAMSQRIQNFYNNIYPNLNDDEMRMLSDDPMIVERFDDDIVMENEHIKLHIEETTGEIKNIVLADGNESKFRIKYYYYPGCIGNNEEAVNRSSGAYIFRPNATKPIALTNSDYKVVRGKVVTEMRLKMNENALAIIRLYTGSNYMEHEWLVGPISIEDGIGKEYVVKYETNILNNGEFYTDSNGRQILKRKLNQRPQWNLTVAEPVAGNYYPVTNEIYIQNDEMRLSVLTDRSQGGTSLVEGDIELMLHRRLLHDDAFGVGEALNETAEGLGLVVRGKHRIFMSSTDNKHEIETKNVFQMHLQPTVFVSDAQDLSLEDWLKLKNSYSWLEESLPNGVHLLTLEPWGSKLLLRLENYLNKADDSTVEVDITKILKNINVKSVKETVLSANQWLSDYSQWKWNKENDFSANFNKEYGSFNNVKAAEDDEVSRDEGLKIKIQAKQIRTFVVDYDFVN